LRFAEIRKWGWLGRVVPVTINDHFYLRWNSDLTYHRICGGFSRTGFSLSGLATGDENQNQTG
jgi:hypothetical protein